MMLLPRPRYEECHSGRCSCVVHGMKDVHHRTSVLHDVCLRDGALTEKDLAVESRFKNFLENPTHFYYWSEEKRDHLLGVPQPFRNNGSWTPVPFSPVLSDCSDRMAAQFYLDIYSKENARKMANIYMTPPSEWELASHPCLGEPEVGSELWRQSHLLYGVKSIPRMNYCQHQLAEDYFYLFLAADPESLLVPVIQRDPATPDLPDKIIGRLMEPFWRQGWGKALCSVCLADVFRGEFQPVFLTRNEFLLHWVEKHLSSLVAVATFSATRLHSRLYQGHVLYLLASHANYSKDLTDSPLLLPTNFSGFQVPVSFSNILSKAILKPPSQPVSSSAPAPGSSQQAPSTSAPAPGSSQQTPSIPRFLFPVLASLLPLVRASLFPLGTAFRFLQTLFSPQPKQPLSQPPTTRMPMPMMRSCWMARMEQPKPMPMPMLGLRTCWTRMTRPWASAAWTLMTTWTSPPPLRPTRSSLLFPMPMPSGGPRKGARRSRCYPLYKEFS
jgi:hypothetical protein